MHASFLGNIKHGTLPLISHVCDLQKRIRQVSLSTFTDIDFY